MSTSQVEVEILKNTKAPPQQENETRQVYLQRLTLRVAEIDELVFDQMTPPAMNWGNEAILALNNSQDVPEFTDPVTAEDKTKASEANVQKVIKAASKSRRTSTGNSKDRYGYRVGSKTSDVIKMFETGAKMSDIKKEFGSPHYNVLRQLEQAGHIVDRTGGIFKLTHKDGPEQAAPETV